MNAPQRFADWTNSHIANDRKFGRRVFRYHPRSDEHPKVLCNFVIDDMLSSSPRLRSHADAGLVVGGINMSYTFTNNKRKTLDLAVGSPVNPPGPSLLPGSLVDGAIGKLRISCEAKQCMTEHSKSKPRIFDELSSSHEIVHQGDTHAIAAGIRTGTDHFPTFLDQCVEFLLKAKRASGRVCKRGEVSWGNSIM